MKFEIAKSSFFYGPTFERGSIKMIDAPLSHGNAIKMFCETVKGERPLLPNWGLPEMVHDPIIEADEVEAIVLSNVKNYFPEGDFTIDCKESGLGYISCQMTYRFNGKSDVITFNL